MLARFCAAWLLLNGGLFPGHSLANVPRDSIPHAGAFTNDPTLSPALRLKIARSALELGTTQTKLPFQILLPGTFSADELPYRCEGDWQALTISGTHKALIPVRVRLRRVANKRPVGDPLIPGARIETGIRDSTIFLIRSLNGQHLGPAVTWYVGEGFLSPGEELPLRGAGAARWSITASRPIRRSPNGAICRITLRNRKTGLARSLGDFGGGNVSSYPWVGDLDGDGKLDFLTCYVTEEAGAQTWTLFLSSLAPRGALFGAAAELYLPGC